MYDDFCDSSGKQIICRIHGSCSVSIYRFSHVIPAHSHEIDTQNATFFETLESFYEQKKSCEPVGGGWAHLTFANNLITHILSEAIERLFW